MNLRFLYQISLISKPASTEFSHFGGFCRSVQGLEDFVLLGARGIAGKAEHLTTPTGAVVEPHSDAGSQIGLSSTNGDPDQSGEKSEIQALELG